MQVKTDKQTRFSDELRIVPDWARVLAVVGFVCMPILLPSLMAHDPKAPPFWGQIALGIACGLFVACWMLLIGYINVDSGRRGMSRLLWTLLAIFVPNALGIILYFLLRQPLPASCPYCGAQVQAGYGFCPKCGKNLSLHCPHCQHAVHVEDVYCPYCGKGIAGSSPTPPVMSPG